MAKKDISVVIPVYGVEKHIDRALRSIFTQSKTDKIEFILVNDCTPDRSMEIAKEVIVQFLHLDIKIINHKKNEGLAVARQTAIDAACGEYILHYDSDDWCEPTMIEDMYNCAKENDADVVVCDFFYTTPSQEYYVNQKCSSLGETCVNDILLDKLHASLWSKLFKRSLFTENNIKWIPGINMWEDMLICSKVFHYAQKVTYLPKAYIHYMQNSGSITDNINNVKKIENEITVINEIEKFYKEKQIYNKYTLSLNHKKIRARLDTMYRTNGATQQKYATLFRETDEFIDQAIDIPWYFRIALKQANKGSFYLFNIIRKLKYFRSRVSKSNQGRF